MNPLLAILAAIAVICAACALAAWLADDTVTVEPDQPARRVTFHAVELCMDRSEGPCPREWQRDRAGWRLCHHHYNASSAGRAS